MTTLAYRAGVLAADSRQTSGSTILNGLVEKIKDLGDGYYSFVGDTSDGHSVLAALLEDTDLPTWDGDDTLCIRVDDDGVCWVYEGRGPWQREHGEYWAWGSGRDIALGALYCGHGAEKAVEAGIAHDIYSGGPIQVVHVGKRSKKKK